jgi:CheY-like chemotaxis protein/DNA-directed RNA polymerase specialized sigma24 family protein
LELIGGFLGGNLWEFSIFARRMFVMLTLIWADADCELITNAATGQLFQFLICSGTLAVKPRLLVTFLYGRAVQRTETFAMTISAIIAPQLPYLRRYARAVSGSQASGDAYVVAMLEAIIEDPSLFAGNCDARTAVYKAFSRIWNAMPLNKAPGGPKGASAAERRLEEITPMPRQAFLLTAVEGFSPEQAAEALGVSAPVFSKLIDDAGHEIGIQTSTSVLVIEDEPIIAMDLERLVTELGHTVAGNARTREEAVQMARRTRPGLVLADIKLADGSSGLDAVQDILKSFEVPVIFITAYPESLLTGERPEPAFLIIKPIEEDMVRAIISQALFFDAKASKGAATAA